jgi:hypothetical protein
MSWITTVVKLVPVIGGLAGTVIDKLWPDRSIVKQQAHEIEMEEMRKHRLAPKTLLRYAVVGLFVLCVLWEGAAAVFSFVPATPFPWQNLLILADTLFGLGG